MKIYMIKNIKNGKMYIGQTIQNVKVRFNCHYNNSGSPLIHNAMRKYGKENFKIIILCECLTKEELDIMETHYIERYATTNRDIGYNISKGGDGTHGYHHTEKAKKAMSKAKKESYIGEGNPFYGKTHSLEVKLKMRKCYVVVFPDGREEIVHGLKAFCIKHNLGLSHMIKVAKGNRRHHKGYWCAYI